MKKKLPEVSPLKEELDKALPESFEELIKYQEALTSREQAILGIPGGVYNEIGQVAIRYFQTVPRVVTVNKRNYAFVVQHNICLSWVYPEDVSAVLKIVGGCCGNKNPGAYRICNALNVKLWQTGDR